MEYRWLVASLITLKLMAKQKSLIVAWRCICIVLLKRIPGTGITYYHGQRIATIRHYIQQFGMTPYRAVFGKDPPPLIRYQPQIGDLPTLQEQLQHRDAVLEA